MTDRQPAQRKGPTQYDLLGMHDEDFESMVGRLVRLEFDKAFKPSNAKDGGADMVLPRPVEGYERCWQAKHFSGKIRWEQCEQSLKDAIDNWPRISEYTFVFPRELTVTEQKTFDRKFRGKNANVEVSLWNGEELQARLTGSDAGRRVARTFFEDAELDRENVNRAIAVGGRLETAIDALEQLGKIGGFLAGDDAFFSYPATTHESDGPGHLPPTEAVMSIGETEGSITRRIDLVPRDEEATERYGPQFRFDAADSEAGQQAAAKLEEALREGKSVEIGEGLDLTFTRLPPAFEDLVGKRLPDVAVTLGQPRRVRPTAKPFRARLEAHTDRGQAAVDLELRQADTVPEGWDDAFVGHYGDMTVTQVARLTANGGMVRWTFRYRRGTAPVRKQLAALKLLDAAGGTGEFKLTRLGGPNPPTLTSQTDPSSLDSPVEALITVLEDVRTIEEWARVEYELPDDIGFDDARAARQIASIIRAGGVSSTWENIEAVVDNVGMDQLRGGGPLRVEREASAALFGRMVDLGYTRLDIPSFVIESVHPDSANPGHEVARLVPPDEAAAKAFEHLVRSSSRAKTRKRRSVPPPPPRKRKRSSGPQEAQALTRRGSG